MIEIRHRDPSLTYTKAIRDDKAIVLLAWIAEFRFTTKALAQELLGSSQPAVSRFIKTLVEAGLLRCVRSFFIDAELLMLTSKSVDFLRSYGVFHDSVQLRSSLIARYSNVLHDLEVQRICQQLIAARKDKEVQYRELSFEKNILEKEFAGFKPDAILKNSNGQHVAIEYERWRKAKDRVYFKLRGHVINIEQERYDSVVYFCSNENDVKFYQMFMEEQSWPVFTKAKSGKMIKTTQEFFPSDLISNYQNAFHFRLLESI